MPDWKGRYPPQAMTFVFDSNCKGADCVNQVYWPTGWYVCARFCPSCELTELPKLEDVIVQWPAIPESFLKALDWSSMRTTATYWGLERGRFLLKSDVQRLTSSLETVDLNDPSASESFRLALHARRKARQTSTRLLNDWWLQYYRKRQYSQRWSLIRDGVQRRYNWELPNRFWVVQDILKPSLDRLREAHELDEQMWQLVQGSLTKALNYLKASEPAEKRPWRLV